MPAMPQILTVALLLLCAPLARADSWEAFAQQAAERYGEAGARAAAFLAEHRPARDADLDLELLAENLDYALRAREQFPWAAAVPEEIFLNDVLPYAALDETRERWRKDFYEMGAEIVANCQTATEAAQALNREVFNKINVHYDTGRKKPNQSPAESIAQGRATCTGLSVILVDACRAVGVPARIAGIAEWPDTGGNHTWVEVWDGAWHFAGADEYDAKGLDHAWFKGKATKAVPGGPHAIWAASWQRTGDHFPLAWDMTCRDVYAVDVTARYAGESSEQAARAVRHLRAWDGGDQRIEAHVRVVDPEGTVTGEVTTRAGRADLNDMPSVTLAPGVRYEVHVEYGANERTLPLVAETAGEEIVELRWPDLWLDEKTAERLVETRWRALAGARQETLRDALEADAIEAAGQTMRLLERSFGEADEGKRSLWISMHGGGGAPEEVNDRQWKNQITLYEPAEGFVVAPRAPTNTWNLWHQAHIDSLFDELIAAYVIARGVDPDRVYLMGYSAGGDGVFQLAPRFADRLAAAAMMAGHPNETKPLGLRNLPFALFAGADDAAYNRNTVSEQWGEQLAALRDADPEGYSHLVKIYESTGHWMGGRDAEALPWMARFTRNAWPRKIVWLQDDVVHRRFYWLAVPEEQAKERALVTAWVEGQVVRVESEDVNSLILRLRDALIDLDQPVTVTANGETVFAGRVPRTEKAIAESLDERADPVTAATGVVSVSW